MHSDLCKPSCSPICTEQGLSGAHSCLLPASAPSSGTVSSRRLGTSETSPRGPPDWLWAEEEAFWTPFLEPALGCVKAPGVTFCRASRGCTKTSWEGNGQSWLRDTHPKILPNTPKANLKKKKNTQTFLYCMITGIPEKHRKQTPPPPKNAGCHAPPHCPHPSPSPPPVSMATAKYHGVRTQAPLLLSWPRGLGQVSSLAAYVGGVIGLALQTSPTPRGGFAPSWDKHIPSLQWGTRSPQS